MYAKDPQNCSHKEALISVNWSKSFSLKIKKLQLAFRSGR